MPFKSRNSPGWARKYDWTLALASSVGCEPALVSTSSAPGCAARYVPADDSTPLAVVLRPLAVHGAALAAGVAIVAAATPPSTAMAMAPASRRRITVADILIRSSVSVAAGCSSAIVPAYSQHFSAVSFHGGHQIEGQERVCSFRLPSLKAPRGAGRTCWMRARWSRIAALVSTLAMVAGLTACSGSRGGDELLIYNAQHESLTKAWVDAFTKE